MIINELTKERLSRPLPLTWEPYTGSSGSVLGVVAKFQTSNKAGYGIHFANSGSTTWIVSFGYFVTTHPHLDPYITTSVRDYTKTGDVYEVLSTVIDAINIFIGKYDPKSIQFRPASVRLKKVYDIILRLVEPELKRLGYEINTDDQPDWITGDTKMPLTTFTKTEIPGTSEAQMAESIRQRNQTHLRGEYEVRDGGKIVGKATVQDGVIELLAAETSTEQDYRRQIYRRLLETIVREADFRGRNLRIQILPEQNVIMRRLLERFGFRHVGQNIFQRTAGSIQALRVNV